MLRFPSNFLSSALAVLLLAVAAAVAQDPEPTPATTPAIFQDETGATEGASPTPVASPSPEPQVAPDLLPESKTLPPQPAETVLPHDLIPEGIKPTIPGSVPNPVSAEQLDKDKVRFRQLRTIAVRDPYAIYFWRRARLQHTDELKREYLRVYYITMCDKMRKLEPRLKQMIDLFEATNVARLSQVALRPTVPGRDVPRFEAVQKRQSNAANRTIAP